MTDDRRVTDLLQRANPVPTTEDSLDLRAETDLARILGTRSRRPVPRRLVPVIAAATVLLTVGAGALVVRPWQDNQLQVAGVFSYQVTDTRPAPVQLREFADRVRALPAEPPTGPVLKVVSRGGGVDYAEGQRPKFRFGETSTYYVKDGDRYHLEDGQLVNTGKLDWPRGSSTDPEVLRKQLAPIDGGGDWAHRLNSALEALHLAGKPSPGVRAAILDLVATVPGVTADGRTTDRTGRPAVAFSMPTETNPVRLNLLFDPETGALLSTFGVTTRALPKIELPKGAISHIQTYLSQTYQNTLPTR